MFRIDRAAVQKSRPEDAYYIRSEIILPTPNETAPDEDNEEETIPLELEEDHPLLVQAREQAEAIREAANQEAQNMIQQAAIQADSMRQEAWQEGFVQGRNEADEAAKLEQQKAHEDLYGVLMRLWQVRDALYDQAEPEVLELAVDIARKVLHIEIERNDEAFLSMVHNAMYHMKLEGKIVLRVSPSEFRRFFPSGEAVFRIDGEAVHVAVVEEDIAPGSCVIDSEGENVNASIESQIEKIIAAFREEGRQG